MSFLHKITKSLTLPDAQFTGTVELTGGQTVGIDADFAASLNPSSKYAMTVAKAKIKSLFMGCKGGDCTIKTNSSGSPADTIALKANRPMTWDPADYTTNPIGTDITGLYVVTGADSVHLTVDILYDP